jgi:hypothetical protein
LGGREDCVSIGLPGEAILTCNDITRGRRSQLISFQSLT